LGTTPWHLLMSATTLMVGPVLVLFLLTQRSFVEGISTSGTKG
jgi:multiple sugar transport system permease protein